ncbi:MAG TPA: peptide-methionine (S)-S-oxide reductase MsrA [Gemmatimonadales bacterium]|nr:peptide-methionine (S)-S-oxide reductase MsrA [Gemmatimonadales bacterium]
MRATRVLAVPGLLLALGLLPAMVTPPGEATAVLAGGCFWGTEAVFEHLKGVHSVVSGFATAPAGMRVPVEAVQIVYDPAKISYRQLLEVFFQVAHDPTSRDKQGPDEGPEYRAAVFYANPVERDAANAYMEELANSKRFRGPIVTELLSLTNFRVAAPFHQDYGFKHPTEPYVVYNDAPKLVQLKKDFPALYQEQRAP